MIPLLVAAIFVMGTAVFVRRTRHRPAAALTMLVSAVGLWAISVVRPVELSYNASPIGFLSLDFRHGLVSCWGHTGTVEHKLETQHIWHGGWGEKAGWPRWGLEHKWNQWHVPLWPLVVFLTWLFMQAPREPLRSNACQACDYDLTGNTSGICPECGMPIASPDVSSQSET